MPGKGDKYRLFSVDDLLSAEQLDAGKATARGERVGKRPDLDSAEMYLSKEDHLLVRGVWPHSAKKSWMVSRIVDVVSTAIAASGVSSATSSCTPAQAGYSTTRRFGFHQEAGASFSFRGQPGMTISTGSGSAANSAGSR